jgi:hypothetical protein
MPHSTQVEDDDLTIHAVGQRRDPLVIRLPGEVVSEAKHRIGAGVAAGRPHSGQEEPDRATVWSRPILEDRHVAA